jgi:integrase
VASRDPESGEAKEKQRRGYSSLEAIDPRDGGKWQVLLPDGKMDWVASQGRGAALELVDTVRWSLVHPRAVFRGIRDLDWAVKEGLLTHSPLARFQKAPKTPRETYLMPAEWDVLMGKVKDAEFLDFLWAVRLTGCRPLEARCVEAKHFFPKEKCWILAKELSKGEKEERCVLLDDAALEICQRWADKYPDGPIFRNTKGRPWTKDAINSRFQRLKVKLPFHCSAYTIRHTFGTDALVAGVGEATVAALMGHKDKTQILKTYQHVAKRAEHLRDGLKKATGDLKPE